jgi:hypothetical protein
MRVLLKQFLVGRLRLRCPTCGREGIARLLEKQGNNIADATANFVPNGFRIIERKDANGRSGFDFLCPYHEVSALPQ